MRDVRWREDGFEGKCSACLEWWPLELQFWMPKKGTRKCRVCIVERNRLASQHSRWRLAQRREYNRAWMRRFRAKAARVSTNRVVGRGILTLHVGTSDANHIDCATAADVLLVPGSAAVRMGGTRSHG